MDPYAILLKRLVDQEVEFVVIGGYAIALHGVFLLTADVDVCASLDQENLSRLIRAFEGTNPVHRFHVKRIPLHEDAASLVGVKNLYLRTDMALIDILGNVPGVGGFAEVCRRSVTLPFFGGQIRVLDIDALIEAKRTAGREKDKLGLMHLEALRRERDVLESRASGQTGVGSEGDVGVPNVDEPEAR